LPVDVPTNIPTNVPVNVPTSVPTSVPVPVSIPNNLFRVPPPVPMFFPLGESKKAGYGLKGKHGYINELMLSTTIFKQGMISGQPIKLVREKSKKKAASKKETRARTARRNNPFATLGFVSRGDFTKGVLGL